ncbi:hypothetical protein SDC9_154159 [bioreactor metagenome]|uniref:Uncharacterized protein n=1 Tax=bioreactor metagenome TaxID=1076179 RepID=A0A645F073_9ZZZZ
MTLTSLAPAAKHCLTTAATNCGLVVAASSGFLGTLKFGLSSTVDPLRTKAPIPPRAAKPFSINAFGSVPSDIISLSRSYTLAAAGVA